MYVFYVAHSVFCSFSPNSTTKSLSIIAFLLLPSFFVSFIYLLDGFNKTQLKLIKRFYVKFNFEYM